MFHAFAPHRGLEGQTIGEYEIIARIGRGGTGVVYKVRQTSLDRLVALKTLHPALADDAEFIARFHREAKAAAALNHTNLVQVHAAGETDGLQWFAMEFVEGESAQTRLKRKERLDPAEAIAISIHVATALEYGWRKAHLIHRDIKPDNIFLSIDGEVKLGDFGLAKSAGENQSLTMTGVSMGTPYYISPEQGQGKKVVDLRTDIYSLGCTLFHLVTGRTPYSGDTALAVMLQHVNEPVPNPQEAWPAFPAELAHVVVKMMAKNPAERQQDYAEVIADLRRAYDAFTGATMVPEKIAVTRPTQLQPAVQARVPEAGEAGPPRWKSKMLFITVLLAVVAFFVFKKGTNDVSGSNGAGRTAARVVDLLSLVNVKRDAIDSTWTAAPEGGVRSARDTRAGRLEFPYTPPAEYDFDMEFTVEDGESGCVMQVLAVPGHWLDWRLLPSPAFGPVLDGVEHGHGPRTEGLGQLSKLKPGDRHRSTVEVRKGSLREIVDGKEIASYTGDFKCLSDPAGFFKLNNTTHVGLGVMDIGLLVHTATVREISGAGNEKVFAADKQPPVINNWQDLTERVREKARAFPNLIIEPGSVRHNGNGAQVSIPLTSQGVSDYAVRLCFVGDGEITLRTGLEGALYVLCQRHQTIFHHYEIGAGAPVMLRPNVPHPSNYDASQPHDLLVTMKGPTLRVWLDDHFVGEANDSKFQKGDAKLVFTRWSVVKRIEVAEDVKPVTKP